jgi:hypothetical protein
MHSSKTAVIVDRIDWNSALPLASTLPIDFESTVSVKSSNERYRLQEYPLEEDLDYDTGMWEDFADNECFLVDYGADFFA